MTEQYEHIYSVRLAFQLGSKDPSHLFLSMSNAIEAFKKADIMLARTISQNVHTVQTIEDLQIGSLFTRIKESFEYSDEEELEQTQLLHDKVDNYLKKGKKKIIENVNNMSDINEVSQIESIIDDINSVAEETELRNGFNFNSPKQNEVIDTLESFVKMTEILGEDENIKYANEDEAEETVSKNTNIYLTDIEESKIEKTIKNEQELILKIKKADFLGKSKWEFKHGNQTVLAKIEDEIWLNKFHKKTIRVTPGDSLHTKTKIEEHYDRFGNLIEAYYTIIEIKEIIAGELKE